MDEKRRRKIERGPNWWRGIKRSLLWDLLRVQKKWAYLMVAAVFVNLGFQLSVAGLVRNLVDVGIVEQSVPLSGYLWPAIIVYVAAAPAAFAARQIGARIGFHMEYDLRLRLYRAFQSADLQQLDRMASGQLVTRALTDLTMLERVMQVFPSVFAFLPLLLGLGIYLLLLNPFLGLISVMALPLNIWLIRRFRHRLWALSMAELNERAEVTSAIDEPVRGIRVVRAFGRQDEERARLAAVGLRTYRFAVSRWRLLARFDVPLKAGPVIFQAVVLLLGASLVANGSLTLGTFLLAFQLVGALTQFAGGLDEMASVWQYLRSAQARIGEVLDMAVAPKGGLPLPAAGSGLTIEGARVTLGGSPVLTGVDLVATPGELLVVHGAPGSGKSTLAALAAGILPADLGRVTLDGVALDELDVDALRRAVRVVPEEPFLFATTVRENLELAIVGDADEEALRRALWAAAADDFVAELPHGLDSEVGDRGLTLSGGQRQRLALARSLVAPPRVLLLDDALSAVNPSLEVEILRRIRSIAPATAVVCISRRRGAMTVADRVHELPNPVAFTTGELPEPEQLTPLAPADGSAEATMAAYREVLSKLDVTDEAPDIPERLVTEDSPARVSTITTVFKGLIALSVVTLVVQTLGRFAPEVLFGNIADVVQDGGTGDAATRALLLVVLGFVGAAGSYFFRIHSQRLIQGMMLLLRRRLFHRITRLGVDHFDRELPGQVATKLVNDLDVVATFLERTAFVSLTQAAQVVIGLGLIVVISPGTFPVVAAVAVGIAALAAAQLPVTNRAYEAARNDLGRAVTTFEEDFTARHDIRSFGATQKRTDRFERQALELRSARRRATSWASLFGVLIDVMGHVASVLVLYRAGGYVLGGALTIGSALTLRLLATQATQPLTSLGRVYGDVLNARVSWFRLKEPYDVPVLPVIKPKADVCPPVTGDIELRDVSFTYPGTAKPVLHDLSLRLTPGRVVALVGYTGAGKSSVAKLVTRTYDPDRGAVLVDGIDLRDLQLDSFLPHVGVVPQDAFVFRGTVRSNIAYGKPDASDEEVAAAAAAVGAAQMLGALPGGFDHPVEEEGRNLTAAQRQLIALARAWIAHPDVLILDEATSCLDADLEQRVLDAVANLGCTCLMVTHRENVVASCDEVVVLDAGRVVETGSPKELIGAGGAFDRLWVLEPSAPSTAEAEEEPAPRRRRTPLKAGVATALVEGPA